MANPELLEEQREETRLIIEELLEDGSDPDALYTIEHHFSADDFDALEKNGRGSLQAGLRSDRAGRAGSGRGRHRHLLRHPERRRAEGGADRRAGRTADEPAEKFEVEYDGWGTYFEDPNGEDGEEGDDEDYVDEDDDGVRH